MSRQPTGLSAALITFLYFCVSSTVLADSPNKRALLIGIDDYKSSSVSDLKGTVNDVMLMRNILIGKFGVPKDNIRVLTNKDATHAGIIDAIRTHLIDQAAPGDVSILHYSGHGSRMRDASGDEIDGWDETIVPHDSRTPGVFDISDDQLNGLLRELTGKTKNVTFILDSCNSGTGLRAAGNTTRAISPDLRPPPPQAAHAVSTRGASEGSDGISLADSNYVLISGSRADQLSNESLFEGKRHGALTWFLTRALLATATEPTYEDVMDSVRLDVVSRYPTQEPQLEGKGTDLVLFGVDRIEAQPYVLVKPIGTDSVEVDAGKVFGVRDGATFKVYPPNTRDFKRATPTATVEVFDAGDFSARARITQGGNVQPVSRAVIEAATFGDTSIPVFVADAQTDLMAKIKTQLQSSTTLSLIDTQDEARIIVRQQDGRVHIESGDQESFMPPVAASTPNAAQTIVKQVKDLTHWLTVLGLQNPASDLAVDFTIRRKDAPADARPPTAMLHNSEVSFLVTNQSGKPIYVTVLDVSSDGSIALLYPSLSGARQELPAGQTLERAIELFVPEGQAAVVDTLKVIATTQPIDPSAFPRGAVRTAPAQRSGASDPLTRFLSDAVRFGTRAARPVDVSAWTTRQRIVRVRREASNISGFSLYYDESKTQGEVESSLAGQRAICPQDAESASCSRVAPVVADGSAFELSDTKSTSPGRAFDEAYQIQELTKARRVEPEFEVRVPGVVTDRGIEKRDIAGDDDHDELANNDHLWSLKQISVFDAWKKVRDSHNVAEGLEASGILIAHPDTGYSGHPEVWTEVNGIRPLDVPKGYDFYEDKKDPKDSLLDDRLIDNPGHGTASGSVIVSPTGCQLPDREKCADGIARGAQLIPLRVHRTVAQINTGNLKKAINAITDGEIEGSSKLVSIAMGGPPSLGLWRATRRAQEKGILMIAASGNYVRTVVWPARFSSTIAVAANNVRCKHWKHSSHGDSVDISAPGESVWRATLNEAHEYVAGMGKGTTFATGNVSGAAALWLSHHRNNPDLEALRQQGAVTEAFRKALRQSSWRPDSGSGGPPSTSCEGSPWDTSYGPGILNVASLLDVPLAQTRQAPAVAEPALEQIPLFASLYPLGTDARKIVEDYLAIFDQTDQGELEGLARFETEILHHYTLNESVQQSIERMIGHTRSGRASTFGSLRRSLMDMDLSNRLRQALTP